MHNQPTAPTAAPARGTLTLAQHNHRIAPLVAARNAQARALEVAQTELARVVERFNARACTDEEYIAARTRAEVAQTRYKSAADALAKAETARDAQARELQRAPVVAELGELARVADTRRAAFIGRYEKALRNFAGELSALENEAVAYVDACASFDERGNALLEASDPQQRKIEAASLLAEVVATTGAPTDAVSTSVERSLLRASPFVQGHTDELRNKLDLVQIFPETKLALAHAFAAKIKRRAAEEARAVQEVEGEKQRQGWAEVEAAAMRRNRFLAGLG